MNERAATRRYSIETATSGGQAVALAVPPLPAALGETYEAALEMTVANADEKKVIACRLTMTTWRTLANPPVARRGPAGTATPIPPTPTATPVFWGGPTPTPTPSIARR
jgi:hypothetical protein